jgi:hypothetical protein
MALITLIRILIITIISIIIEEENKILDFIRFRVHQMEMAAI